MGLIRLLMLLVVAWIGWRIYRILTARSQPRTPPVEEMVRCAHCDLHLPRSAAVRDGDSWYCSEAHRSLGGH